jgi:ABC-type Fe3+/spermidine/putrescine transport system ATPase subunit
MSFLKLDNLNKVYSAETVALVNFSLDVRKGERLAVIGASGSGKSTLLKIIAGLEVQDGGKVYLEGSSILNPSEKLVPGYDEIQLVKQDNDLYPNSTVAENIGRPLLQYDKAYAKERLDELIHVFGLEKKRDQFPRQLSGGQQQKVAIARALSLEPAVLLLDEPFSSLDAIQKRKLLVELNLIFQEIEITMILVTHDMQDALLLAEEICILKGGKLLRKGNPQELYEDPRTPYVAGFFGPINPIPGKNRHYLRSSAVTLHTDKGRLKGKVLNKRYLPEYDLLTVEIPDLDQPWQISSANRTFHIGQDLFLDWSKDEVLVLDQ